ncbi:hypothetical protein K438DRAFT_1773192 [Mycena galopus ATCC 62051]|nr:hypothetical protein K438DRAFT_1773192 [Mycena galopus ATCC 62051]
MARKARSGSFWLAGVFTGDEPEDLGFFGPRPVLVLVPLGLTIGGVVNVKRKVFGAFLAVAGPRVGLLRFRGTTSTLLTGDGDGETDGGPPEGRKSGGPYGAGGGGPPAA